MSRFLRLQNLWLLAGLLLLTACDSRAITKLHDPSLKDQTIACLKLELTPDDDKLLKAARQLYPFTSQCAYRLRIEHKSAITCNSAHRSPMTNYSAYLRMDLYRGLDLVYSYYIDLNGDVDSDDLLDAFGTLKESVNLGR